MQHLKTRYSTGAGRKSPGTMRGFVALFMVFASFLFLIATPVRAQERACEVALVLAIDASSSVNPREYVLQMEGAAAALLDPDVTNAILSLNGVYLAGFEWNGESNQSMLFPWTYLQSEADIRSVADKIVSHQRNTRISPTALGSALGYAHRLFPKLPSNCFRKVIDVSGDGASNHGIRPSVIYQIYDFSDITVNGLAIVNPRQRGKTFYEAVDSYYKQNLLHGPGAFVIVAEGFPDFARAMRIKLLSELAPSPVGLLAE